MAATKKAVSKKSNANTSKNLNNLPQSVRRSTTLSAGAKILANYLITWHRLSQDGTFFRSNADIAKDTGLNPVTVRTARASLCSLGIITYTPGSRYGESSTYQFSPEIIKEWEEEQRDELIPSDPSQGGLKGRLKGGLSAQDNNQAINKLAGLIVEKRTGDVNPAFNPAENAEILDVLRQILAEQKTQTAILLEIKENTQKAAHPEGGLKGGLKVGEKVGENGSDLPPITISTTITTTTPTTTSEKENQQETTHSGDNGGGVLVGVGGGGCDPIESQAERQAQAVEHYNTIVTSADRVIAKWRQDRNTTDAEANLKSLCNEIRAIRPTLPQGHTAQLTEKLKAFKCEIDAAPIPTQRPQYDSNAVYEVWAVIDNAVGGWQASTDPHRTPRTDVVIGQALQRISQMKADGKASESQCNKAYAKANDYYVNMRGFTATPHLSYLLGAMTPAETTPAFSELLMKRSEAQAITYTSDWVKRRQNAPEGSTEHVTDAEAQQTIGYLDDEVRRAENMLRCFPNESIRIVEDVKARLRTIFAEGDKWDGWGVINRVVAAPIIAIETMRSNDASVVSGLCDVALNCGNEAKDIREDIAEIIATVLNKFGSVLNDDVRGIVTRCKLQVDGLKVCHNTPKAEELQELEAELAA